jgi:hypothetical protein
LAVFTKEDVHMCHGIVRYSAARLHCTRLHCFTLYMCLLLVSYDAAYDQPACVYQGWDLHKPLQCKIVPTNPVAASNVQVCVELLRRLFTQVYKLINEGAPQHWRELLALKFASQTLAALRHR